ncbi:helix-turn-helix domain-containing protein [Mesorhizobium sp. BR1-1-16]|nr:helix-turn-helix domain-containing protein [Mesorhizobium sp. BR1-1-16]
MTIAANRSQPGRAGACPIREGAEYLGVSEPTLWRLLRDGTLPRVRLRGRTLVRFVDLDALLARASTTSAGARS